MAGNIYYVSNTRALKDINQVTLRVTDKVEPEKEQVDQLLTSLEKKPECPNLDPLVEAYNDCKQKLLEQDIIGSWKPVRRNPFTAKYDGQFRVTFGLGIGTSKGGGGSGNTSGNIKATDKDGNVFWDIPLYIAMQGQYWRSGSRASAEYSSYSYQESIILPVMKGMIISYSGAGVGNPMVRYYEKRYYGKR